MAVKFNQQLDCSSRCESFRKGRIPQFAQNVKKLRSLHTLAMARGGPQRRLPLVISFDHEVSKSSIHDLKGICLRNLRVGESFKGGYLALKTLEIPRAKVGVTTVVVDRENVGAIFTLCNATADVNPDWDRILPCDTTFIIKEPFCTESDTGDCIVHCENPTDMIVIYEGHPLYSKIQHIFPLGAIESLRRYFNPISREGYSDRGVLFAQKSKYELAIGCYMKALRNIEKMTRPPLFAENTYILLSASCFHLGYFELALKFATTALKIDPDDGFGLDKAGSASYMLRKYLDAHRYFYHFMDTYQSTHSIMLVNKINRRLVEHQIGKYDIHEMYNIHRNNNRQSIDRAEYVGPIKVVPIEGKGRGVVATRDINRGTLLCVSKALAFSWITKTKNVDDHHHQSEHGSWEQLVVDLGKLIARNPSTFGPEIFSLCDDSCPLEEGPLHLFADALTMQEPIVDMCKLKNIVRSIFFGNCQDINGSKITPAMTNNMSGCGVFSLPSYFNHSCLPNASVIGYNDVLFIRAIQKIKTKEEIFIPYISYDVGYADRLDYCFKRGFQCFCQLCEIDRAIPMNIHLRRKTLLDEIQSLHKVLTTHPKLNLTGLIDDLSRLLDKSCETFTANLRYPHHIGMSTLYFMRAKMYASASCRDPNKREKEVADQLRTLQCLGFDVINMYKNVVVNKFANCDGFLNEIALTAVYRLFFLQAFTGDKRSKNEWYDILVVLENIYSGGDENVVQIKHLRPIFS